MGAQFNTRLTAGIRGSGRPLSPVRRGLKPQGDIISSESPSRHHPPFTFFMYFCYISLRKAAGAWRSGPLFWPARAEIRKNAFGRISRKRFYLSLRLFFSLCPGQGAFFPPGRKFPPDSCCADARWAASSHLQKERPRR